MRYPLLSEPLRALLGEDLWAFYELDDLFVGTFEDGDRWVVRQGLEWLYGPLLGAFMADVVFEVARTSYPPYTPQWA